MLFQFMTLSMPLSVGLQLPAVSRAGHIHRMFSPDFSHLTPLGTYNPSWGEPQGFSCSRS